MSHFNNYYSFSTLWSLAKSHKKTLIQAYMIAIVAALLSVPVPLLLPLLVDEVLLKQPATLVTFMQYLFPVSWHGAVLYIVVVLLVTLVLRFLSVIFGVWQARYFALISKDITFTLRTRLLKRLQRVSMAEYETLGSGKVIAHLVTDMEVVDTFIGSSVSKFVVAVLTLIGSAAILLYLHWQLALFILFLNPIVVYFTIRMGKKVKQLKKAENKAFEVFQEALSETLDAILQIRASNREQHYIDKVITKAAAIKTHATAFSWRSDAAGRLSFVIFLFGFDMFRAISMMMVLFSDLSLGEMFAITGYILFMMSPIQELLTIQYGYYGAKAALGRINKLFDLHEEPQYPHISNPFKGQKAVSVRLQNVYFSYTKEKQILQDISLHIEAGETVAFVGVSGGGKSTLVQILLGLYPVQQGNIYYAGKNVQEIGLDIVREHVACVFQHPVLFNDTVRMNITLGHRYPEEVLWKALEIAQLKPFISHLDKQLDTVVGKQGVRFSGGQRQRLVIARMILLNPQVVILDEATSALDTKTEAALHAALQSYLAEKTTIIIAHRFSALKQADRVYVFDQGVLLEQGNHQDLLQQQGLYARLYEYH